MKKNQQKKIGSLTVLKFVAMLLIVWWHIGIPNRTIDWGARMCEFLFVASGFLVGYNYFYKGMPNTISYCFKYTFNKLKKFWPLHFLCLLVFMILNYRNCILGFRAQQIPTLLANVFLLQAWSPDVENVVFSYNGLSWFLSALIFCYFISPFLINFIKKKRIAIPLFIIIAIVRISIDICVENSCNIFYFSTHTSPIVRALEYFMGMLMVPVFIWLKEKIINRKIIIVLVTLLEIGLLVALFFVLKSFDTKWQRSYFVLVFCFIVFVFAFDLGGFSIICSNKFVSKVASIQLEMYLLQVVVNLFLIKVLHKCHISLDLWPLFWSSMVLLLVVSVVYKISLEARIAKIFDKITNQFYPKTDVAVQENQQ